MTNQNGHVRTRSTTTADARSSTRLLVGLASLSLAACAASGDPPPAADEPAGAATASLTANIAGEIQIDNGTDGADLFDDQGTPLNAGAALDWVDDEVTPNAGVGCLGADAVASCNEANVTAATGGVGAWHGVRIVDGIAAADQDIFLTGGKENEFETWNIGPGSVGSSKYDITQAYLANNQTSLYFGMERRGNNGTTFFDFEFNQFGPDTCATPPNVPCRTVGDVLFGFEMQGSGSSGSATPYYFIWDGTAFVQQASPPDLYASINQVTDTEGGPWGHVDRHGNWVLGDLDRFQFGEAVAPLSLLPGVDACGGEAWVQVRTRSSATANSDLKDTTRIFRFEFLSLTAAAVLTPSCDGTLGLAASAQDPNGTPIPLAELTCTWSINDGAFASGNCTDVLATGAGTFSGTVTVGASGLPGCSDDADSNTVTVYVPIAVDIAPGDTSLMCPAIDAAGDDVTYTASASGGSGNYSYSWSGCSPETDTTMCTVDPADGDFCADQDVYVTVSDDSGICPPVDSETESYAKVTVVTSTDLP